MSGICVGGDLFDGNTCTVHPEVVSVLWIMSLAVSLILSVCVCARLRECVAGVRRSPQNFAAVLRQSASSRAVVICMTQVVAFATLGCLKLAGEAVGADASATFAYCAATIAGMRGGLQHDAATASPPSN